MRRSNSPIPLSVASVVALSSISLLPARVQANVSSFESEQWTITNGRIVDHLGRKALAGSAILKEVVFTDGIIEVDMAMDGRRCFPGIIFRAASEADTEVFYVRPHRPKGYSHALQYAPRFNGVTGWQLYSGPGFTAGADIALDRWVHVRLEVTGTRARVYFDDSTRPALVIEQLQRGTAGGYIGVTGPADGRVHFSNFRFVADEKIDFGPLPIRPSALADLNDWELSQPLAPQKINRDETPATQDLGEIEWQKVKAQSSGLVDVARFLRQAPALPQCVLARATIRAEQAERRKLLFGYSDEISIFLNDRLLFRGDSSFRVRDSEFVGAVGLNDAVVLELSEGQNELLLIVTESLGGWGFVTRTENLRTEPVLLADGVARSWELSEGLMMPESAVWDAKRACFYVSNVNPAGAAGVGEQGYIMRIDPSGNVLDKQWVAGLRGPTGVAVLDDRLFVVERTGVAVIDLEKGEIVDRLTIESKGGFLNDIAVSNDGTIFVSDSGLGAIYRLQGSEPELWLKNETTAGVNGLVTSDNHLFATTMGSESLVWIRLETGEIEGILNLRPFGGDGITADGQGAFLVSDYNGLLLRVTPTGGRDVLVDTRDVGISLTDFAFAPEQGLVVIPTLRGNTLQAFTLR